MVYELGNLPTGIHNRFHVDLLRRAASDPLPSQEKDDIQPPPLIPQTDGTDAEYEVEQILRAEKRRVGRGFVRKVLVKWKGYADPTWEPRSEYVDVIALDEFEQKFGKGDGVGENIGSRTGPRRTRAAFITAFEAASSWHHRSMALVPCFVPPTSLSHVLTAG